MKKLFTCLLMLGSMGMVHAQNKGGAKLSAFTRQYLSAYKELAGQDKPVKGYVYKMINGKRYISAFIKVNGDVPQAKLDELGVYVGTRAGSVWTVQIPVDQVEAFTTLTGISDIDMDMPVYPSLDNARKYTKADSAQTGINLPMPMNGKGVIVGVIDAGFDLNHPTMYDTNYAAYRIKKVWLQKNGGTPPTGFAYGNEITDTNVMKTRGFDTAILSHGTHVTGIAAGSGYGSNLNKRYKGMAYASDIVLVGIMPAPSEWLVAGESDIVDGMNYIFSYATSVGQPAVVNLSWGSTIGPHDGNSLFSQACDGLTGPGKIFVCAAGNNGQDTVHLGKTFTPTDTVVSTFVTFSPYLDSLNEKTWVDVWGDTSASFCLKFKLYDTTAAVDSTPYICIADTTKTYYLKGSNGDTCLITVTMVSSEYNHKPHAIVYFYSRVHDHICMTTKATGGTVDMWEGYIVPPEGYYGALKNLGYSWAVSGDVNMTVSDIGCTKSAITVGAHTTKTGFVNILGQNLSYPGGSFGRMAPFSSYGPTEDYRIKPDIAAPGVALSSSVNSYDTSYLSTGTNYIGVISASTQGGRTYQYAMLAGTSMASPCASGIVAMMLQLLPTLTPDSVKSIMAITAIHDTYTGTIPASGTNWWGHGKLNAYAACKYIAQELSVQNTLTKDPMDCILFPNPNKGTFTISYMSNATEQLSVEVYDITGKLMSATPWFVNNGQNSKSFSTTNLAKGVYLTKISSAKGSNVIRMVVN